MKRNQLNFHVFKNRIKTTYYEVKFIVHEQLTAKSVHLALQ